MLASLKRQQLEEFGGSLSPSPRREDKREIVDQLRRKNRHPSQSDAVAGKQETGQSAGNRGVHRCPIFCLIVRFILGG
jgi:hypothetical protein